MYQGNQLVGHNLTSNSIQTDELLSRDSFICEQHLFNQLFLSCYLSPNLLFFLTDAFFTIEIYTRHWSYEMLVARTILGQKVKGQGQRSFEVFVVSTPWLRANLTDLLYTWPKYSPWHGDVSPPISRSKGQRSRSHRSFELKVTSY